MNCKLVSKLSYGGENSLWSTLSKHGHQYLALSTRAHEATHAHATMLTLQKQEKKLSLVILFENWIGWFEINTYPEN